MCFNQEHKFIHNTCQIRKKGFYSNPNIKRLKIKIKMKFSIYFRLQIINTPHLINNSCTRIMSEIKTNNYIVRLKYLYYQQKIKKYLLQM